ncbi:hypothetical protein VX159_08300 [Dechloromonas sp. ZY10]|uniref:hypothetical protein n=1 Tax=Dechloromonas aquae TaxID=2664436 RepID=UPI003528442C
MRPILTALPFALALSLAACSSQPPATQTSNAPATTASAAPAATKAPQCWNGDRGLFMEVGSTAVISGVEVSCEKTSDGKNAQWMGKKH